VENIGTTKRMVRFVATDGHRLSLIDRDIRFQVGEEHHVIIPRKGIVEIKKILQEADRPARIAVSKSHFILACGEIKLFVRLIDGVFPNYKDVIPKFNQKKVKIDRTLLLESLRRASIMSIDRFRGVRLEFQKNGLIVSSSNPDVGESEEKVPVDYTGETLQVSFNSRYLIDILNAISAKTVVLHLNDEMSAAMIKEEGDEAFLGVIMPMRI
jgi:DNA polymerase-3 subunit beta